MYAMHRLFFLIVAFGIAGSGIAQSTYLIEHSGESFFPIVEVASRDGSVASFGVRRENDVLTAVFLKTDGKGDFVAGKRYSLDKSVLSLKSAIQATDGSYLLLGVTGIVGEEQELFLLKLSPNGSLQWKQKYNNEFVDRIFEVPDGFLLVGLAKASGTLLMKVDPGGIAKWKRVLAEGTGMVPFAVESTPGGFLVAAAYSDANKRTTFILMNINSDGKVVWSRKYLTEADYFIIGQGSIAPTADNHYLVAASMRKGATNTDRNGILLLKADSAGRALSASFQESPVGEFHVEDSKSSGDGGIILVGRIRTQDNTSESAPDISYAFAMKAKADGKWEWRRIFDEYWNSSLLSVALFSDNTIATAGFGGGVHFYARLSPNGQIYEGCDKFHSFPMTETRIRLDDVPIAIGQRTLPFSPAQNLIVRATNYRETGLAVCSGTRK